MAEFIGIVDQQALDRFREEVDAFHDALIREMVLTSTGRVLPDGSMLGHGAPVDARVIIHSQNEHTPVIELACSRLVEVRWCDFLDLDELDGTFDRRGIRLFLAGPASEDRMLIAAETIRYRILGSDHLNDTLVSSRGADST